MISAADILTGAHVWRAWRVGLWLCLDTDKGRVDVAAGRVRLDLECPKCLETRLVEIVNDSRGQQGVCAVCAHSWWLPVQDSRITNVHSTGE